VLYSSDHAELEPHNNWVLQVLPRKVGTPSKMAGWWFGTFFIFHHMG
jgi:hypothetical protein